jgi:hypothetical protein
VRAHVLLLAALACACSKERTKEALAPDRTLLDRFVFAASGRPWSHRRTLPKELATCSDCFRGACLCVGAAGELWLDVPPFAELAPQLLPEDLLDVWQAGQDWRILGSSGTVYVLRQPTESVARVLAPPFRFDKTLRLGSSLIAIGEEKLFRSDDAGASWQPMLVEPKRPIDVAVDGLGRLALLELPESIWQSTDRAQHFGRLERPNDGVTALLLDQNQIRAASLLQGKVPLLPQATETVTPYKAPRLRHPIADYLGAPDFLNQHVARFEDHYLVARPDGSRWTLREGLLGRPLSGPWPMPGITCSRVTLAARRHQVWAFCSDKLPGEFAQPIALFVSDDGGHDFARVEPVLHGVPKSLRVIDVEPLHGLLVTGICPADTRGPHEASLPDNAAGCRPSGIWRLELVRGAGKSVPAVLSVGPVPTPALAEPALAMAASPSGMALAVIAKRSKLGALTLLTSRDGGRSFDAKTMSDLVGSVEVATGKKPQASSSSGLRVESLSVAEDGTISLTTKFGDRPRLYTFDAEAVLQSAADAPKGVSRLAVFEDQALALSVTAGVLYESVDQGANFEPIAQLSPAPCRDGDGCDLVCQKEGCLVGDRLTRLGYRHRVRPQLSLPATLLQREFDSVAPTPPTLASCEFARQGWQRSDVIGAPPDATTSSFGALAFYWLGLAENESNVLVVDATRTQRRLSPKRLFSAGSALNRAAVAIRRHPHGWAAARIAHLGASTEPLGHVEFAWSSLDDLNRLSADARFADRVGSLAIDKDSTGPAHFTPGWLSPLAGDLFVQLSAASSSGEFSAQLVAHAGAPLPLRFDGWHGFSVSHGAVLDVAGQATPFALAGQGMVLLRGSLTEPTLGAVTIAPKPEPLDATPEPAEFSYLGNQPGVVVRRRVRARDGEYGRFYRLGAGAALIADGRAIPRVFDPNAPPPACDGRRRQLAERLVVATDPSDGVLVTIGGAGAAPMALVSKRAVLYLDAAGACWDVVEASDASNATTLLLFADVQQPSWLFRTAQAPPRRGPVESATLNCRVATQLRVTEGAGRIE